MKVLQKLNFVIILFSILLLLSACDSPEEKYEKHIQRGDAYFQERDYTRARLEYKNAAQINPINPKVIYSLGLVEEAQGNIQAALSAFLTAEHQDPNYEPVVQKLAEFFVTAQQDDEATARIQKLLTVNPKNSMGHALNASILLKKKKLDEAETAVSKAFDLDKNNIIAYSVKSGILVAKGMTTEAIQNLDEGIKKNADDVSLYLLKAVIYSNQNDFRNVQSVYEEIFAINPDKISYRFDLAQILSIAKNTNEAEKVLRETVDKFPDNEEAKRQLVILLEQEKGVQSAENQIKAFLETNADQKTLYLWLAELYIRNKHDDLAVAALQNILDNPGDEWVGLTANNSMARIKLSHGDIELAKRLIEIVLSKDINNAEALLLRANLALSSGDYEQALGDVRNVIRDNPKSAQAARMLTEILVFQNKYDLAIDTLLEYHKHENNDLGAQVRLSQLYAIKGNVKQAFDILDQVSKNDPTFIVTWETLARLSIENKLYEEAEKAITQLKQFDKQEATILFLEGQLLAAQEQYEEAMSKYGEIISSYGDSALVDHALSGMVSIAKNKDQLLIVKEYLNPVAEKNTAIAAVLAGIHAELGDDDKAIETLQSIIEQKPQTQVAYLSLATLYKKKNDVAAAMSVLEQAEKDIPYEPKAGMMRAEMLVSSGDIDGAIHLYESMLKINESTAAAAAIANNLAHTIADYKASDKDQMEKARIIAERFINSDNPYYLDTLAWVYYKQGNITMAEQMLNKARSLLSKPNEQIEEHYKAIEKAKLENTNGVK